jgi:hypothetical protein
MLGGALAHIFGDLHRASAFVKTTADEFSFGRLPSSLKLRRDKTAGQGKCEGEESFLAVNLTTMTDSLHSHNSNHVGLRSVATESLGEDDQAEDEEA